MAKKSRKQINFLNLVDSLGVDTDGDGLTDKEERRLGTNPYAKDTDRDGLSDFEEIKIYRTNPNKLDTDGDGMSDGDEVRRGRNPNGPGSLQDYFIPHAGNGYEPHALRHHRLAFHATSAIVIKIILFLFLVSYPLEAWLTPDISSETSQQILKLTNDIRKNKNIPPLKESSKLNQSAIAKAEDMLLNQYFDHVSKKGKRVSDWFDFVGYNYSVAGENLALGFTEPQKIVEAWTKSPTHYLNMIDKDFKEVGVGVVDGVYAGQETLVVAQHFGTIKTESQDMAKLPESVKVNSVAKLSDVVIKKDIKVGERPKLVFPPSNYLSKNEKINLRITADGYIKVKVFIDGELTSEKSVSKNDPTVLAPVALSSGKHEILIAAINGDKKAYSLPAIITVDSSSPVIEKNKTEVIIGKIDNDKNIISATAYLSPDTKSAELNLSDYKLKLHPDSEDANLWVGRAVFTAKNEDDIFNPLVMATVSATDQAGTTAVSDVGLSNITLVKSGIIDKYLFLKKYQPKNVQTMFAIAANYYWLLLVLSMVALIFNIFIAIKKQHPRLIISSLGFVFILLLLIII